MTTLQLMNLTALAFVAGSVLFTVASVPYLWQFASHQDERRSGTFLASQYVAGSVLSGSAVFSTTGGPGGR
ncbi:MAG: hypothetical protein R3D03_11185 [Geminicoccaceae bacterium]